LSPVGNINFAKSIYNISSYFDIKRNLFTAHPIKLYGCYMSDYASGAYNDSGIKKAAFKGSPKNDYHNVI
jgi:hypothetical protein